MWNFYFHGRVKSLDSFIDLNRLFPDPLSGKGADLSTPVKYFEHVCRLRGEPPIISSAEAGLYFAEDLEYLKKKHCEIKEEKQQFREKEQQFSPVLRGQVPVGWRMREGGLEWIFFIWC